MKFPLWWSRVYLHVATYGKMFVEGLLVVTDVYNILGGSYIQSQKSLWKLWIHLFRCLWLK